MVQILLLGAVCLVLTIMVGLGTVFLAAPSRVIPTTEWRTWHSRVLGAVLLWAGAATLYELLPILLHR